VRQELTGLVDILGAGNLDSASATPLSRSGSRQCRAAPPDGNGPSVARPAPDRALSPRAVTTNYSKISVALAALNRTLSRVRGSCWIVPFLTNYTRRTAPDPPVRPGPRAPLAANPLHQQR
jgi:hypothetical protein